MNNTAAQMKAMASALDQVLNPNGKKLGFVLLVLPFDQPEGARTNYVSNCDRKDMVAALKEMVARFEGQPRQEGRA